MEVTVIETGDLPSSTIISFHTGTVRRHAQMEKNKAINLSDVSGSEPVRVDLTTQIGSHTFDLVPGQDVYDVPITPGEAGSGGVKLKFRIREAAPNPDGCTIDASGVEGATGQTPDGEDGSQPGSPSRKLQTALMMRSYLDNHDVLEQMQELLQDMVTHRPEDPIDYMIQRLEQVCRDNQGVDIDMLDGEIMPQADAPFKLAPKKEKGDDSEEEDDDDDEGPDMPPPPPPGVRTRKASVSEEAYGAFNQRKAFEPKFIKKDESQKQRIKDVLKSSWMFKSHSADNVNMIVDAMAEKVASPNEKLIAQGEEGHTMWVIEEGTIECYKTIDGKETLVKTCSRGDIFGELALLYGCPRAASVFAKARCVLWELDRETFKAICYEAAQQDQPRYSGFVAPGQEGKKQEKEEDPADDEDGSNHSEGEAEFHKQQQRGPKRREGVSAEACGDDDDSWTPPVFPKTPEERTQLSTIIKTSQDSKLHMLFGTVSKDTFEKIIDACQLKTVVKDEHVIEQGAVGDFFYIVKCGDFDIFVKKGQDAPKKVFQAGVGFAFGELALLYNAPRTATITSQGPAEVWALERTAFRNLVVKSAEAEFKQHLAFLSAVDVFQVLTEAERASLAEVLEEEDFEDDEAIVEQGEKDDKMFILRRGKAVACIKGEQGEVEVMTYQEGSYFGEIALLSGEPRKASVYAVGQTTCLYITRATFLRVLGSLSNILERNIGKYEKYQDAMKSASTESEKPEKEEEQDDGDGSKKDIQKVVHRKRERKADKADADEKKGKFNVEKEPETLADKVAQDFKNPALVTPAVEFKVPNELMMLYGGLLLGQKFTYDKLILRRALPEPIRTDTEFYAWSMQTKLKAAIDIGVVCQKGQKSASDPTPNQDNYFVHQKDGISMYGVADGHGPFGHLVSFRLVQTLPHFLVKRQGAGKDWEQILTEGFLDAQADLCSFCGEHSINIEASGAAGSVLVMEEQTIHIAFIGDARVMVGSWNRKDTRMIFCSNDHKPCMPEEKARLEAAGSEVREIDPGNWRIYLPGSNFPGLTMSRAFGDTACAGVLREPEYHKILMQPTDQWFALVASDGIWEHMEGSEVYKMSEKKLRLKGPMETLNFLVGASRKRWQYCCGDYCDDISAILVQWNAPQNQESKHNHTLVVRPPDGNPSEGK